MFDQFITTFIDLYSTRVLQNIHRKIKFKDEFILVQKKIITSCFCFEKHVFSMNFLNTHKYFHFQSILH